jgi:hypothetical protein
MQPTSQADILFAGSFAELVPRHPQRLVGALETGPVEKGVQAVDAVPETS